MSTDKDVIDPTFATAPAVWVYKASAVGNPDVPDLHLIAAEPIPDMPLAPGEDFTEWERRSWSRHREQAAIVANALLRSLPGATIDQLLIKLLEHRASHVVRNYLGVLKE